MARLLGIDAAELHPPIDPPPQTGDLKAEITAFRSIEDCVAARGQLDPVLGDAIDALGYDLLLHDACRIIGAMKERSAAQCEPIGASSLRDRCMESVAVVSADETSCPLVMGNHEPTCLALARRDVRLCVNVPTDQRSVCRAALSPDLRACAGNKRCERAASRWKTLIPTSESRPELRSQVQLDLTEVADGGAETQRNVDLSPVTAPASLTDRAGVSVLVIGDANTAPWPSPRIAVDPRASIVLKANTELLKPGEHKAPSDALSFQILVPQLALLSSASEQGSAKLQVERVTTEIGGPVRFRLMTELEQDGRRFRIQLNVQSYVRDVVKQQRP